MEDVLENTLWNLIQEAQHGEFHLTQMPRTILQEKPSVVAAEPSTEETTNKSSEAVADAPAAAAADSPSENEPAAAVAGAADSDTH